MQQAASAILLQAALWQGGSFSAVSQALLPWEAWKNRAGQSPGGGLGPAGHPILVPGEPCKIEGRAGACSGISSQCSWAVQPHGGYRGVLWLDDAGSLRNLFDQATEWENASACEHFSWPSPLLPSQPVTLLCTALSSSPCSQVQDSSHFSVCVCSLFALYLRVISVKNLWS